MYCHPGFVAAFSEHRQGRFTIIVMGSRMFVGGLVAKSCPTLATPWTVACQAPLSMGFSRQDYWRGLPCCLPGDLPDPGMEPASPASLLYCEATWEAYSSSVNWG